MRNNRIYSMILSIMVAFGLWLYVVNNVSEGADITFYNIPVSRVGEAVLKERNMMVTAISNNTVSVNLAGSRSDLNQLDSSNMSALIDLSLINEPGTRIPLNYTMSLPPDVSPSDIDVTEKTPHTIFVDVDYRRTYEVPVQIKWVGTRSENYIYDTENYTLDSDTVSISGPAAVADTIESAVIEIDLTDRSESISESFRYTLCDSEGNPVDAAMIITNQEEIRVDAQISRIRDVKLVAEVVYGGGATPHNTSVTLDTETIRVSGGDGVLADLGDTYTVCTINLAEIDRSVAELKYSLNLPEGVTNQTGVTEVKVTVRFHNLKTREFSIDTFQAANVPQGLEAEIITANLTIKVRGPENELNALEEEDILATVDFTNAEVGTATYKVNITFGPDFSNVGVLKTNSVSATVQAAGD